MKTEDIAELLKPRFKCIGHEDMHYPGSPFNVGKIIRFEKSGKEWRYEWAEHDGMNWMYKHECDEYPHLFQPLPWYAEREESEMPEYVKWSESEDKEIAKVTEWINSKQYGWYCHTDTGGGFKHIPSECKLLPATESEYLSYINSKK